MKNQIHYVKLEEVKEKLKSLRPITAIEAKDLKELKYANVQLAKLYNNLLGIVNTLTEEVWILMKKK